jgi:hypothetical protein
MTNESWSGSVRGCKITKTVYLSFWSISRHLMETVMPEIVVGIEPSIEAESCLIMIRFVIFAFHHLPVTGFVG